MTALLAAIAAFNVGIALGRIFERLDYHRHREKPVLPSAPRFPRRKNGR